MQGKKTSENAETITENRSDEPCSSEKILPANEEFSFEKTNYLKTNETHKAIIENSSRKENYSSLNERVSESARKEDWGPFDIEKLKEIKQRLFFLLNIPKEKWTPTDVQFISLAFEPKLRELLSKI